MKRAPAMQRSLWFQEEYLRGVVFVQKASMWQLAEAESYTAVHITLKRMPVYSTGYVNAVQRQCDRSG